MEGENENNLTGYPRVISYECSKTIIDQMKKNICKLKIGEEQGTGFFCEIPFPNEDHLLKVLITNNHVINEQTLKKKDAVIPIDIEEEPNTKYLNLNNRIKYTSEKYDTTIIELKENDDIKNYLKLDDKIIEDIINSINKNDKYKDETVYIIQYPEGKLSVSYGIIGNIFVDKKYDLLHKCSTNKGSSGSPIINIDNNKVIGIHKKGVENKYNKGTFLNFPIKEFIQQNHKNVKEENKKDKNENKKKNENKENKEISLIKSNIYDSITKDNLEEIRQIQLKRSICWIKFYENYLTGFLCLIPLINNKSIKALITFGDYIKYLDEEKTINLSFDEGKISVNMKLSEERIIIFIEKEWSEIMIIEIKESDIDNNGNCLLNSKYFLELDENSTIKNNFENYSNKQAYMLKYIDGKSYISIGKISEIDEKKGKITHFIDSGMGSMGSPILNLDTLKVFGIHKGRRKLEKNGFGIMLYFTIKKFIDKINSSSSNY